MMDNARKYLSQSGMDTKYINRIAEYPALMAYLERAFMIAESKGFEKAVGRYIRAVFGLETQTVEHMLCIVPIKDRPQILETPEDKPSFETPEGERFQLHVEKR